MADVPRYFDPIEKVVKDARRDLNDLAATVLARLGALQFPRVVAATSEVTTPYAGQIVFNTTDYMLYRYDGATWLAFASVSSGGAASFRHEARYEHKSSMNFTTSTDTKIKFDTADYTSDDVTASGTGNTDFALNRAGLWLITSAVRYNGNAGAGEVSIRKSRDRVLACRGAA